MFEEVASGSGEVSFPRKIPHSRWLLWFKLGWLSQDSTINQRWCFDEWESPHQVMVFHPKEHHLVVRRSGTGGFSHGVWGEHWIGTVGCRLGTGYEREDPCRFFSATGAAHRRGNGKLRRVKVGSLWIQELVEEEEIFICKVPGAENIAHSLTKHVGASLPDKYAANMGIFFPSGRAESRLHLWA